MTGEQMSQRPGGAQPGVKRVALVLRPERDLHHASNKSVPGRLRREWRWSAQMGNPRLPGDIARYPDASLAADCDAVLSRGGDGTMLGALRLAAPHGAPVLGVNLGRLGYLTEVDAAHLGGALAALGQGDSRGRGSHRARAGSAQWRGRANRLQRCRPDPRSGPRSSGAQPAHRWRAAGALRQRRRHRGDTPRIDGRCVRGRRTARLSPGAQGMIVMPDAPHGLFNRAVVLAEGERLGIEVLPTERARFDRARRSTPRTRRRRGNARDPRAPERCARDARALRRVCGARTTQARYHRPSGAG